MSGLINPTPPLQVINSMNSVPYLNIIYFTGTPSAGSLVVHPTSDGTATGTAVFSNIFHATATPWVSAGGALTATPLSQVKAFLVTLGQSHLVGQRQRHCLNFNEHVHGHCVRRCMMILCNTITGCDHAACIRAYLFFGSWLPGYS